MAKDRGRDAKPGKAKNPPKTGRAGKGPGNSPNKDATTAPPYQKNPKVPTSGPGPGRRGPKPPRPKKP